MVKRRSRRRLLKEVDEDVDIYNPDAIEWAIATRFQGHKDMIVMEGQPGSSLDPSGDHSGKKTLTTKIGFDATKSSDVDPSKYTKVEYKAVNLDEYRR